MRDQRFVLASYNATASEHGSEVASRYCPVKLGNVWEVPSVFSRGIRRVYVFVARLEPWGTGVSMQISYVVLYSSAWG